VQNLSCGFFGNEAGYPCPANTPRPTRLNACGILNVGSDDWKYLKKESNHIKQVIDSSLIQAKTAFTFPENGLMEQLVVSR